MGSTGLSSEEIYISNSNPPNSNRQRGPSQEKWNLADLLDLVQAKREEDERDNMIRPGSRQKAVSVSTKWKVVMTRMAELGVVRSGMPLKKQWDRLQSEFKKVNDYERHIPSGQPDYYSMDKAHRRDAGLPLDFPEEVFTAMSLWFTRHRNVVPDPSQILETEDVERAPPGWRVPTQNATTSSPNAIQGVTCNYERFGQKRSKRSVVDAEVRPTIMPKMLEQMSRGLEVHRQLNVALIELKGEDMRNRTKLLELKEKEINVNRDSMDRIAMSIEHLASAIGNRMGGGT